VAEPLVTGGFPSLKKPPSIIDMSTNGILDFQGTNKATFVGENSNVVIDTVNASFGIGVDVNGPTSNLHVVGNAYVTSNLEVGTANLFVDTSTSNVGIGTNAPGYTLDVVGDAAISSNLAVGTNKLFVDTVNSRVGVGTTDPLETLDVRGTIIAPVVGYLANQDAPYLIAGTSGYTGAATNWNTHGFQHRIKSNSGGTPRITVDTSQVGEAFTIVNNGNVGIGTTDPGTKLHVNGDLRIGSSPNDTVDDNNSREISTAGQLTIKSNDSGLNNSFVNLVLQSGNTNPGKIVIGGGTTDQYRDIEFYTSGSSTERMRIHHNGNVGIGTTNPIAALDIDGGPENDTVPALSIRGGFYPESDLYVLNTYNVGSGVGYAAKVIGVNIKNKVETDNTIQIRSNTGGLTSAGAMYFGSDNYDQGVFGVLTGNGVPGTDLTERFRIDHVGKITSYHKAGFVVGNPNSGDGDDYAASTLDADWNAWVNIFNDAWIGGGNGWGTFWAGSSGARYRKDTNDTNPNEYVFVGGGNKRFTFELNNGAAYFDGTLSQSNYDYAEYFEWEDGNLDNEDRRGYSVVLRTDGKIMKATSDDEPTNIIGIVSGTSSIVGDAAGYDWHGKYEVDEWGTKVTDEVYQLTWTEDGENHSYDEDRVPEGITVPESGVSRRLHNRERIAPGYDDTVVYIPRDKRKEWCTVGLLGKVRLRDGCPTNPNWRYMKTIAGKELWLIR